MFGYRFISFNVHTTNFISNNQWLPCKTTMILVFKFISRHGYSNGYWKKFTAMFDQLHVFIRYFQKFSSFLLFFMDNVITVKTDGGSDNDVYGDFHTIYAKRRVKSNIMEWFKRCLQAFSTVHASYFIYLYNCKIK